MRWQEFSLSRDLDKILAIIGVIASLLLIVYLSREMSRVIYLLTGVMTLISCIFWLIIRKSDFRVSQILDSRNLTLSWAIGFFIIYTLSILAITFRAEQYERPLVFFILISLMAGIIACESSSITRQYRGLILIQILLLGGTIAWSQQIIFPSLLGFDPWYHSQLTTKIIANGYIPSGYTYAKLPIFHLMVSITALLSGLTYKSAAILSVSLGQILCNTLFIYLISIKLFKNHHIGSLAALLVVIANHHISMSVISIPNSMAGIFIPIILYLFLFRTTSTRRFISVSLILVLMVALILTHTITALCMAILLFAAWGMSTITHTVHSDAKGKISLLIPAGFTIIMFAWWTYASGISYRLVELIEWGFSVDFFDKSPLEVQNYIETVAFSEQLMINIGMFLFFATSFIGIFYMISKRGNTATFIIAGVGVMPLAIGFISLISGHSVIEHRWWYFAQILLSIPLAVAINMLSTWKTKRPVSVFTLVCSFVIVLSFLSIMSPAANIDNHIFTPNIHVRNAPIESELQISTIINKSESPIKTDFIYSHILSYQGYNNVERFCQEVTDSNFSTYDNHLVIIREEVVNDVFVLYNRNVRLEYDLLEMFNKNDFVRIYDSGTVYTYKGVFL